MLLRVWRMSTAASAVPSTNAGITMRCTLASGLSQSGTKPEAGSQPRRTEKNRISMIPSQKLGTDTPQSDAPLASTSHAVLRRTAARTPAGIAIASAMTTDRHASSTVIGSLRATVTITGSRVRIERPRSPCRARPAQRGVGRGAGVVRPLLVGDLFAPGGGGGGARHYARGVARNHPHADEDDDADHDQRHDRDRDPTDQEFEHRRFAASGSVPG